MILIAQDYEVSKNITIFTKTFQKPLLIFVSYLSLEKLGNDHLLFLRFALPLFSIKFCQFSFCLTSLGISEYS